MQRFHPDNPSIFSILIKMQLAQRCMSISSRILQRIIVPLLEGVSHLVKTRSKLTYGFHPIGAMLVHCLDKTADDMRVAGVSIIAVHLIIPRWLTILVFIFPRKWR